MEIKIKKLGWKVGSSGWLAKGIESAEITIYEALSKNEKLLGLWVKTPNATDCLAVFGGVEREADGEYLPAPAYSLEDSKNFWTPGAVTSLLNIAREWCDTKNKERESDPAIEMKIKYIEVEIVERK